MPELPPSHPALTRRAACGAAAAVLFGCAPAHARASRLPDGEISRFSSWSAWLTDPTRRYAHAVLGDDIEAGGFAVAHGGRTLAYSLPENAVFEDRRVRLVDMDGDGRPEALIVKAYLDRGAALALYRVGDGSLSPLAESSPIGSPNRWLNPVGTGRLSGGPDTMIAAVITPHLAGSLRLYRLSGGKLEETARIDGYTNHIIGSRDLDLGHIVDIDGDGVPEIVLPTLNRQAIGAISFKGGSARVIWTRPVAGRIRTLDRPRDGIIMCRFEDGASRAIPLSGG